MLNKLDCTKIGARFEKKDGFIKPPFVKPNFFVEKVEKLLDPEDEKESVSNEENIIPKVFSDYIKYHEQQELVNENKRINKKAEKVLGYFSSILHTKINFDDNEVEKQFMIFLNNLKDCFSINPELTVSIIRLASYGKHGYIVNRLSNLDIEFKQRLLEKLVYKITEAPNNFNEIKKNIIGGGIFKICFLDKDKELYNYSNIPDNKMGSIIYEFFYFIEGKLNIEFPKNISLLKRIKKMETKIKPGIFNKVFDFVKYGLDYENILREEEIIDSIQEETLYLKILKLETEEHCGLKYNPNGFDLLQTIPIDEAKQIFFEIISNDLDKGLEIIRCRKNHAFVTKLMEVLSDEILEEILKIGISITPEIKSGLKEFKEIDTFSIFRSFTLLHFDKIIPIIEKLDIVQNENILYILYLLNEIKEYPTSRIRHLCKEGVFNKRKILKAYANIKLKDDKGEIYLFLKNDVFGDINEGNIFDFDYDLIKDYGYESKYEYYETVKYDLYETINIFFNIISGLRKLENIGFRLDENFEYEFIYKLLRCKINGNNIESLENPQYCKVSKKEYLSGLEKYKIADINLNLLKESSFIINLVSNLYITIKDTLSDKVMNDEKEGIEDCKKATILLETLARFIGKYDLENNNLIKLNTVIYLKSENISGKIKVLDGNDEEALKNLSSEDIVVVYDYTTLYQGLNLYVKPKAIIFGTNISRGSHSVAFAKENNIPCYHMPLAENYFIEYNGLYVEILKDGKIKLLEKNNHINPYDENRNIKGEKSIGLEKSELNAISLSGELFYDILNTNYGYIDDDKGLKLDFNEHIKLPFEDLKQLFNTLKPGKSINYEKLSRDALEILSVISIKPEILDKLIEENNIIFPLALRSDFLNEDRNGIRNAGVKDSYLNIRNKKELVKYIIEMIKQDFSPKQLEYKIINNIYPVFCTFGAIIQEMAIKQENEAERLLSGVATVELDDNGKFVINSTLCIGLNEGITDSKSKTIESQLDGKEFIIEQNSCRTIDSKNGGTKKYYKENKTNITFDLNNKIQSLIRNKLIELSKDDLENDKLKEKYGKFEISFEFSVLDGNFLLLQKNIIKL